MDKLRKLLNLWVVFIEAFLEFNESCYVYYNCKVYLSAGNNCSIELHDRWDRVPRHVSDNI